MCIRDRIRSSGWWVYVIYLPIYAVEHGYSDRLGGIALSISNGLLFLAPLMLRWIHSKNVRHAVVVGFLGGGTAFIAATLMAPVPAAVIAMLVVGSTFLILLDICAGLPYLMAVKPSERTEMSAVYSTFRDVSGVLSPSVARLVLAAAPLVAVFAVCGIGLAACGLLALKLHPRLGKRRLVGA